MKEALLVTLAVALLPVVRGLIDYLFFNRLGRGESREARWWVRPVILGSVRPYHVALALFDAASLYLLWQVHPVVSLAYLGHLLFATPDALWYHCWKGYRWTPGGRSTLLGDRYDTRLPVKHTAHPKSYPVWPIQLLPIKVAFGRMATEGEYRASAAVAYVLICAHAFASVL